MSPAMRATERVIARLTKQSPLSQTSRDSGVNGELCVRFEVGTALAFPFVATARCRATDSVSREAVTSVKSAFRF